MKSPALLLSITENRLHWSELQVGEPQRFQLNYYSRCWITAAQDRTLAERHSQEGVTSIAYDQQLPAATDQIDRSETMIELYLQY